MSFFERLKTDASAEWRAYTEHPFPRYAADAARPRKRGDRIEVSFAAAHESPCGIFRTRRYVSLEFVQRSKADIANLGLGRQKVR